jgi:DNA-directed RNA polymerase subunit RPC12/RpoP
MTDTERERINAICEVAGVAEIDDLSDGFHTFRQLYYQRMMLFATIVKQNKDKAWKSLRHEDGELCFGGGWFIVGIDTPEGSYTYHYEDNYYSLFDCEELERGKHWDGHTEKDVTRLLSLPKAQLFSEGTTKDAISRQAAINAINSWRGRFSEEYNEAIDDCENSIKELPTIQPEQMEGEWVHVHPLQSDDSGAYMCSKCKTGMWEIRPSSYHYCPNCGARMTISTK